MEQYYKLFRVRELADNDDEFVVSLIEAFLEEVPTDAAVLKNAVIKENHQEAYQAAHKMKPTIDLFELGVLDKLIEIEGWGKTGKTQANEVDVTEQLRIVISATDNAIAEMKSDFNL